MSSQTRPYRMKRRAELEAETRRRITESTVALHGTLGPARTSISAVADHAGVRRSTVYRHFPDEDALFAACSAHWLADNPVPDVERWAAVADPDERTRAALEEMYAYYRRTERMLDKLFRDEALVPSVRQMFSGFRGYLAAARDVLVRGRRERGRARRRAAAAIGHALAFHTWRSLTGDQGLDDRQAVDLMCRLIAAAGGRRRPGTSV